MKPKRTPKKAKAKAKAKPKAAISFKQPPNAGKRSILNTPLFR